MIDLNSLKQYRENNRIEAKKSLGGLSHSIWETYSAFANTLGGIILLGVEELPDGTLHAVGLPDPDKLIREFWDVINNPNKANVNILTNRHVRIEDVDGLRIIVIEVPRAQRYYKPVFVNGNPVSGTYRRNGEGDYHCTDDELRAMYRDASIKTQDMLVLDSLDTSVFCHSSIKGYRQRMSLSRPNHVWELLDDEDFLMKVGAMGIGEDGKIHPTAAGLLMFGYEYEIVREYPQYFLDYREIYDDTHRWTDRVISSSGDWSGNLFDFYYRVYNRIQQDIKIPFALENGHRVDDTPVHKAIREALANCLINADYYGRQGLVITKEHGLITMSNPGDFRIDIDTAKSGGVSDPRNGSLMKMFNLIDVGERAGSGIPSIFSVWKQQGWDDPVITQTFEPNRILVSLPLNDNYSTLQLNKRGDKKVAIKSGDKKVATKAEAHKNAIIAFLEDHGTAKSSELCDLLDLKPSRVRVLLKALVDEGIITSENGNKNRIYRLK